MKRLFQITLFLGTVAGLAYAMRKFLVSDSAPATNTGVLPAEPVQSLDDAPLGGQISDDLLKILVCPEDKGALELVDDGQFLLNPRNGYKYPIRNGIPVMLIEEGKKYRDASVAQEPVELVEPVEAGVEQ